VLQQVRQAGLRSKILILSSSLDDERVLAAVRAGADGYILKASRVGELVQAIVRVAQGQRVLDSAVTQVLVDHLHEDDPVASLSGAIAKSRRRSTLARRPCGPMWRACWTNSACATARRLSSTHSSAA